MINKRKLMYELLQRKPCTMLEIEKELDISHDVCKVYLTTFRRLYPGELKKEKVDKSVKYSIVSEKEWNGNQDSSLTQNIAKSLQQHPCTVKELCIAFKAEDITVRRHLTKLSAYYGNELKTVKDSGRLTRYSITSNEPYIPKPKKVEKVVYYSPWGETKAIPFPKRIMTKEEVYNFGLKHPESYGKLTTVQLCEKLRKQGGTVLNRTKQELRRIYLDGYNNFLSMKETIHSTNNNYKKDLMRI